MGERLGPEWVGCQPQDYEIFAAFALFSEKGLPQDEARLAEGLREASKSVPFLSRFVDETGNLSDSARQSLVKLQEGVITSRDGVFVVADGQGGKLTSSTRTYFKAKGIDALKDAAVAAAQIWFPN